MSDDPYGDGEDVRQAVAEELRRIADDLESDELGLTEPLRYTRRAGHRRHGGSEELPSEVEITYATRYGERTVEVYV